ncbi:MAG TPA: type III pantothenate kinase [Rhodanobacteraceae bacterium]|nr:type III pantothenate kinase [Rhodanobacteraceae bacterium]
MRLQADNATWLFDLGNSRLKGAWLRERELAQGFALAWDAPDFDAVLQVQLARWPAPTRALVASVVASSRADRLRIALQAWPKAEVQWLRSPRQGCGVTSYYRVPERLGIDRFLAMAAARGEANGRSVIVAGCGTALTLDAVDASGAQREGLIAPSPDLMLRSLHGATAIADNNLEAFAQDESDDTAHALRAGCTRSAAALVEWYCARQRAEMGEARLYLHGGWAASLKPLLAEDRHGPRADLLDDAVLRGLALWAKSREQETANGDVAPG